MPPPNEISLVLKGNLKLEYPVLKKAVLVLRAANHPVRELILSLLNEKKRLAVTDIYIKLRQEQSVVSQHLAVLRNAGIVTTEKNGKFVYYTLNRKRIAEIGDFVNRLTHQHPPKYS